MRIISVKSAAQILEDTMRKFGLIKLTPAIVGIAFERSCNERKKNTLALARKRAGINN